MWLPLTHPIPGTWPVTRAWALTGDWTSNPLISRPSLNPLSPPARAQSWVFLRRAKSIYQKNGLLKEPGRAPPTCAQTDYQDVCSFMILFYFITLDFIYYLESEREEEREGEKHWCERERELGCLLYIPGNQTGDLSLFETTPNQLSHTGQGLFFYDFNNTYLWDWVMERYIRYIILLEASLWIAI